MKSNRTVSVVTIVGLGLALLLWASPGLAQVLSLDGVNATLAGTDLGSYSTIQNSEWDGNNSPPVGYPYGTATLNVDTTSADASYGGLLLDSPTDTSGSFGMYNEDLNVCALNLNKIGTGTLTLVGGLAYSDTTYIGANILYTGNTTVSCRHARLPKRHLHPRKRLPLGVFYTRHQPHHLRRGEFSVLL